MNIYVGNLSYQTTEDELRSAFGAHGEVSSVAIIKDRETGRSKGFAFVEMVDDANGQEAIRSLDGADLKGRNIKVNEARPREERSSSGPRGGGGYGGGGGRRDGGGGGGRRDRW